MENLSFDITPAAGAICFIGAVIMIGLFVLLSKIRAPPQLKNIKLKTRRLLKNIRLKISSVSFRFRKNLEFLGNIPVISDPHYEKMVDDFIEEVQYLPQAEFTLYDPGDDLIIDYAKYGEIQNPGTKDYHYLIKDRDGLALVLGEGIYPNRSVYHDPEYKRLKSEGKLEGDQWDFVNTDDHQLNFYKWATIGEEPGVKLFYTALALERAGLLKQAIKAYYANVILNPRSVGWTYWHTPWYVGPASIDRIHVILRDYPQLGIRLADAHIEIINGYDNDIMGDSFIINPGRLEKCPPSQVVERKDLDGVGKRKVSGEGDVKLIQYNNGHWRLEVKGEPFLVRGMAYTPTPVGKSPHEETFEVHKDWMFMDTDEDGVLDLFQTWADKDKNDIKDENDVIISDFELMKRMGVNTIRLYHHGHNKGLLRFLHKKFGFMFLMGDFLGMYGIGSDAPWEEGTDYTDPQQQQKMLESVQEMVNEYKDEPYILMWVLGNENNYSGAPQGFSAGCQAGKNPVAYYSFVEEVTRKIKRMDSSHPVAICNGDLLFVDTLAQYAPSLDVIGLNSYRGSKGFGRSLWRAVKNFTDKPVLLTEYGCPAYFAGKPALRGEQGQAYYHFGCWKDILFNAAGWEEGNCIGGVAFQWLDGWWKAGAEYSPSIQDTEGQFKGPFPDGSMYEEWLGITSQGKGKDSPFLRQLRLSFYFYHKLWNNLRLIYQMFDKQCAEDNPAKKVNLKKNPGSNKAGQTWIVVLFLSVLVTMALIPVVAPLFRGEGYVNDHPLGGLIWMFMDLFDRAYEFITYHVQLYVDWVHQFFPSCGTGEILVISLCLGYLVGAMFWLFDVPARIRNLWRKDPDVARGRKGLRESIASKINEFKQLVRFLRLAVPYLAMRLEQEILEVFEIILNFLSPRILKKAQLKVRKELKKNPPADWSPGLSLRIAVYLAFDLVLFALWRGYSFSVGWVMLGVVVAALVWAYFEHLNHYYYLKYLKDNLSKLAWELDQYSKGPQSLQVKKLKKFYMTVTAKILSAQIGFTGKKRIPVISRIPFIGKTSVGIVPVLEGFRYLFGMLNKWASSKSQYLEKVIKSIEEKISQLKDKEEIPQEARSQVQKILDAVKTFILNRIKAIHGLFKGMEKRSAVAAVAMENKISGIDGIKKLFENRIKVLDKEIKQEVEKQVKTFISGLKDLILAMVKAVLLPVRLFLAGLRQTLYVTTQLINRMKETRIAQAFDRRFPVIKVMDSLTAVLEVFQDWLGVLVVGAEPKILNPRPGTKVKAGEKLTFILHPGHKVRMVKKRLLVGRKSGDGSIKYFFTRTFISEEPLTVDVPMDVGDKLYVSLGIPLRQRMRSSFGTREEGGWVYQDYVYTVDKGAEDKSTLRAGKTLLTMLVIFFSFAALAWAQEPGADAVQESSPVLDLVVEVTYRVIQVFISLLQSPTWGPFVMGALIAVVAVLVSWFLTAPLVKGLIVIVALVAMVNFFPFKELITYQQPNVTIIRNTSETWTEHTQGGFSEKKNLSEETEVTVIHHDEVKREPISVVYLLKIIAGFIASLGVMTGILFWIDKHKEKFNAFKRRVYLFFKRKRDAFLAWVQEAIEEITSEAEEEIVSPEIGQISNLRPHTVITTNSTITVRMNPKAAWTSLLIGHFSGDDYICIKNEGRGKKNFRVNVNNGSLYLQLICRKNSGIVKKEYVLKTKVLGGRPAEMATASEQGPFAILSITRGENVQEYALSAGTAKGKDDVYRLKFQEKADPLVVPLWDALEKRKLYIRLYSKIASHWCYNDYLYQPKFTPGENKIINWLDSITSYHTGFSHSFWFPADMEAWLKTQMSGKEEWAYIKYGSNIYDQAHALILRLLADQNHRLDPVIQAWKEGRLGELGLRAYYVAGDQDHPFDYGKAKGPDVDHYMFKTVQVEGKFQFQEDEETQTWVDWLPFSGDNAWVSLGAMQVYHETGDLRVLRIAEKAAEGAILLQADNGGIRMAPVGTYHSTGDPAWFYQRISTDDSIAWYAAFRMLSNKTGKLKYFKAMKRIESFLKASYDDKRSIFYAGMYFDQGQGKWLFNNTFVTRVQLWAIAVLGVEFLDTWLWKGASRRMWQRTMGEAGVMEKDTLLGLDFTNILSVPRKEMVSYELTATAILVTLMLVASYKDTEPVWAEQAGEHARQMKGSLLDRIVQIDKYRTAFSYASGSGKSVGRPTGLGWYAPTEEILNLASTAWASYVKDDLFNPFLFDGKIPVVVIKPESNPLEANLPAGEEDKNRNKRGPPFGNQFCLVAPFVLLDSFQDNPGSLWLLGGLFILSSGTDFFKNLIEGIIRLIKGFFGWFLPGDDHYVDEETLKKVKEYLNSVNMPYDLPFEEKAEMVKQTIQEVLRILFPEGVPPSKKREVIKEGLYKLVLRFGRFFDFGGSKTTKTISSGKETTKSGAEGVTDFKYKFEVECSGKDKDKLKVRKISGFVLQKTFFNPGGSHPFVPFIQFMAGMLAFMFSPAKARRNFFGPAQEVYSVQKQLVFNRDKTGLPLFIRKARASLQALFKHTARGLDVQANVRWLIPRKYVNMISYRTRALVACHESQSTEMKGLLSQYHFKSRAFKKKVYGTSYAYVEKNLKVLTRVLQRNFALKVKEVVRINGIKVVFLDGSWIRFKFKEKKSFIRVHVKTRARDLQKRILTLCKDFVDAQNYNVLLGDFEKPAIIQDTAPIRKLSEFLGSANSFLKIFSAETIVFKVLLRRHKSLRFRALEILMDNIGVVANRELINLHTHTSLSDGSISPQGLLYWALTEGVSMIAVTDHSLLSFKEIAAAEEIIKRRFSHFKVICGTEVAVRVAEKELHVIVLFPFYKKKNFLRKKSKIKHICQKLNSWIRCSYLQTEAMRERINHFYPDLYMEKGDLFKYAQTPNIHPLRIAECLYNKYRRHFRSIGFNSAKTVWRGFIVENKLHTNGTYKDYVLDLEEFIEMVHTLDGKIILPELKEVILKKRRALEPFINAIAAAVLERRLSAHAFLGAFYYVPKYKKYFKQWIKNFIDRLNREHPLFKKYNLFFFPGTDTHAKTAFSNFPVAYPYCQESRSYFLICNSRIISFIYRDSRLLSPEEAKEISRGPPESLALTAIATFPYPARPDAASLELLVRDFVKGLVPPETVRVLWQGRNKVKVFRFNTDRGTVYSLNNGIDGFYQTLISLKERGIKIHNSFQDYKNYLRELIRYLPHSRELVTAMEGLSAEKELLDFLQLLYGQLSQKRKGASFEIKGRRIDNILEINARTFVPLHRVERNLHSYKKRGIDTLYLMGIWQVGEYSRKFNTGGFDNREGRFYFYDTKRDGKVISRGSSLWAGNPQFAGSSFSITGYNANTALGGRKSLDRVVRKSHKLGLKVVVDFIPNHLGVDTPLLDANPGFFITRKLSAQEKELSDNEILKKNLDCFIHYTAGGERILVYHAKDPNSGPWKDTVQLDITSRGVRDYAVSVLEDMASRGIDGVRCDMSMLVLKDVFSGVWGRYNEKEYWQEVIQRVKAKYPHFIFIAESYWQKEGYLQELGFDYTYDKYPLDIIKNVYKAYSRSNYQEYRAALGELKAYIAQSSASYFSKSLHFTENHDEERARNLLGDSLFAAYLLLRSLPGAFLHYQGQIEGYSTRTSAVYLKEFPGEHSARIHKTYRSLIEKTRHFNSKADVCVLEELPEEVVGVLRFYKEHTDLVLVNFSPYEKHVKVDVKDTTVETVLGGWEQRVQRISGEHLNHCGSRDYQKDSPGRSRGGIFKNVVKKTVMVLLILLLLTSCSFHGIRGGGMVPLQPARITIGTINAEKLGKNNPHQAKNVAEIIKRADVDLVAVQEIMNFGAEKDSAKSSEGVPMGQQGKEALEAVVGYLGDDWGYLVSDEPNGTSSAKESGAFYTFEYYAYIYKKSEIEPVTGSAHLWDEEANPLPGLEDQEGQFDREPYIVSFRTKKGKLDFTLITIHAAAPKAKWRQEEINRLPHVYRVVQGSDPDQNDVFFMGDFNTEVDGGEWDAMKEIETMVWLLTPADLTTIYKRGGTLAHQYDTIWYQEEFSGEDVISGSVKVHYVWKDEGLVFSGVSPDEYRKMSEEEKIKFYGDNVSDHLMVTVDLWIHRDTDNFKNSAGGNRSSSSSSDASIPLVGLFSGLLLSTRMLKRRRDNMGKRLAAWFKKMSRKIVVWSLIFTFLFSSMGIKPSFAQDLPQMDPVTYTYNMSALDEYMREEGSLDLYNRDFYDRQEKEKREFWEVGERQYPGIYEEEGFQVRRIERMKYEKPFMLRYEEEERMDDRLWLLSIPAAASLFFVDDGVRKSVRGGDYSPAFDRYLFQVEHLGDARYGMLVCGGFWLSGTLLEDQDMKDTCLLGIESMAVAGAISSLMKLSIGRLRPCEDKGPFVFKGPNSKSYKSSFPSGHTTMAFSLASVVAEQSDNVLVDILSYGLASSVAFQRMYDDKHWLSDVFLGAVIGIFVGKKIVSMHKEKQERDFDTIIFLDPVNEEGMVGVSFRF